MKCVLFGAVALMSVASSDLAQGPAGPPVAVEHYGKWGVDLTAGDPTIKPGDDFVRYSQGAWLDKAVIPADQTRTGTLYALESLSLIHI